MQTVSQRLFMMLLPKGKHQNNEVLASRANNLNRKIHTQDMVGESTMHQFTKAVLDKTEMSA